MEYKPDKTVIARRIAQMFQTGDVVNLGIGLPTLVANHLPEEVTIVLQSENGFVGLGPAPAAEQADPALVNAGAQHATILPGGAFFDSATSFGIIRGGHLDYTVLGVLEVDQTGNLANYMIPGKMVPGMGGAMDLVAGARTVIAATVHFNKNGSSKLVRECTLPLTARQAVDYLVTDLGFFDLRDGRCLLKEVFAPYTIEYVCEHTDADVEIASDCRVVDLAS